MKNFVYLLLGIIIGLLLTDRSRATPLPVPAAPARRNRTLEEIAPMVETEPDDVGEFGSIENYVGYMKILIDELLKDGLTEKEAHLVAEHLKLQLPFLVDYQHHLEIHKSLNRHRRTEKWVEEIEEGMFDDQEDGEDGE